MTLEMDVLCLIVAYSVGLLLTVIHLWHDRYLQQEERLWYWVTLLGTALLYPLILPAAGFVETSRVFA